MLQESSADAPDEAVIVTGASRGLGLAISKRLVEEGYCVAGIARSETDEFASLRGGNHVGSGRAVFYSFDLEKTDSIQELVKSINAEHGVYGLINNAAIGADGVLATMHNSEIQRTIRINLEAPLLLAKYAGRLMLSRRRGRIVNVSSIIASTGFSGLSVYAATKAGLDGMTRSLAREIGRAGVTVNTLAPGYMETDMTQSLAGEKLESVRRRCPLGLATVDDVAGAVSYLIGPDGAKVTGTTVTVDGGSTA